MSIVAIALVVLREVLEVALTIVILLAATKGVSGRRGYILGGLGAGLLGSVALAFFTDSLSQSFEGVGQELFNAGVLITSAVLVGSTVVWMARNVRQFITQIKDTGHAVVSGAKPRYMLSLLVGLTMLRDGAEVVLLASGWMSTGLSSVTLWSGITLGTVAGTGAGILLYLGFSFIPTRWIFSITNWILIFVAAGMAQQGASFLSAAGKLPELRAPFWDTSAILSETSFVGGVLHIIFGYAAKPSAMQVIWYFGTLAILALFILKPIPKLRTPKLAIIVPAIASLILSVNASAIDKIYSPIVDYGEYEIESRGTHDFDSGADGESLSKMKVGVGYGFTDWYYGELNLALEQQDGEEVDIESGGLESRFQLTDQGEYWLDLGLYFEGSLSAQGGPDELEGKVLLEKELGRSVTTVNLTVEQPIGENSDEEYELEDGAVIRYRLSEAAEPAIEWHSGYGEIGDIGSWSDQEHHIGPAVYGALEGGFVYELAWLFGISNEASDNVLRFLIEYEFH